MAWFFTVFRFLTVVWVLVLSALAHAGDGGPLVAGDGGNKPVLQLEGLQVTATPTLLPEASVPDDPGALINALALPTEASGWIPLSGTLLMLAVWVLRKLNPKIPPIYVPAISFLMASGPGVAVLLMKPGVQLHQVVLTTFLTWVVSNGLWSGVVEQVGRLPPKAPPGFDTEKTPVDRPS